MTTNKTIKLVCDLKFDNIVATINTLTPGLPQYSFIKEYRGLDETDWSQFNCWRPVFVPRGLTKEYLLKKQKELYRRFYLRSRMILRYIKSFVGPGDLQRLKTVTSASMFIFSKGKVTSNLKWES